MGHVDKPSTGLTPEEKDWLRRGDGFWGTFRDKGPERRDLIWFLFGAVVFWFGSQAACPLRPT